MDPLDYLRALRQRWRIVIACVIIAVLAAWVTTPANPSVVASRKTQYTATATLLRDPGVEQSLGYVALFITRGEVPKLVAKKVGYTGDPAILTSTVVVTPDSEVGTITIQTTGNDGRETAALANTFATEIISYLRVSQLEDKQERIGILEKTITKTSREITVVEEDLRQSPDDVVLKAQRDALAQRYGSLYAELQSLFAKVASGPGLAILQKATPIASSGSAFTAPSTRSGRIRIALIAGLLLGAALALVLDRFDTRLRRRDEVQDAMGLPVLAEVPRGSRGERRMHTLFMVSDPGGSQAQAYRGLRSSMLLLPSVRLSPGEATPSRHGGGHPPAVILVVSAKAGDGKTTTAANFAVAMAESGKRVLFLDCDFRAPFAHKLLDVPWGPGLSDLWDAEASELLTLSRPTAIPNLRLVTAGTALDRPLALPTKMSSLIQEARSLADVVVIDSAPLLTANEAIDLMPYVDSVLVVCRSGRTTRDQAHRSVELLGRMRVPVSGIVLNGTPRPAGHRWEPLTSGYGSEQRREPVSGSTPKGED